MLRDKPYRERIKLVLALLAIWSLLPVFTKAGEATERKDFPEFSFDLPGEGWKEIPTPKSPGTYTLRKNMDSEIFGGRNLTKLFCIRMADILIQ
jgi:hypothetical protein